MSALCGLPTLTVTFLKGLQIQFHNSHSILVLLTGTYHRGQNYYRPIFFVLGNYLGLGNGLLYRKNILPRIWAGKEKLADTKKFLTGNYLEVGKGLPYRKSCFQNYIGNNFGQDGSCRQ